MLRLLQGFVVSGEEGGAVVLLFEQHSFKNKGMIGSVVLSSNSISIKDNFNIKKEHIWATMPHFLAYLKMYLNF
jgi:hypothetical protein